METLIKNMEIEFTHYPPPRKVGLRPFHEMKGDWIIAVGAILISWIGAVLCFFYCFPFGARLIGKELPPQNFTDVCFPYLIWLVAVWVSFYFIFPIWKDWHLFKYGVALKGEVIEVIFISPQGRSIGTQIAIVKFSYDGNEKRIKVDFAIKPKEGDSALVLVDPNKPTRCKGYIRGDNYFLKVKT